MNKEEKKLQKYIIKKLESKKEDSGYCTIPNRSHQTFKKLSQPILKNILKNKFYNGACMEAVVCMFDNLFSSIKGGKRGGLYELSTKLSKWIKKYEKRNTDSSSGYIYITDIFTDIEVIIKSPKDDIDDDNIIREYFIGISEINKLRYILPTFVYTFGAFLCPIENGIICRKSKKNAHVPFVIYENIPGKNMEDMLKSNSLTFPEFLGMFLQILLGLEVAQRNLGFCHYDLHSANLMCRNIDKICKYSVPLDNKLYEVSATKYLPVIIDFGLSTVISRGGEERPVGSYEFERHGMFNYMLPGVDMYKFLVFCISYAKDDMYRKISNLLLFYGGDDPYKILVNEHALDNAINEYVKMGSYSRVTTKTPLEYIEWILEQPEYMNIANQYINKRDRDVYIPLTYSMVVDEYETLFNNTMKGKDKAIKVINNCVYLEGSYVMSMYSLYVLNGYNNYSGKRSNDSLTKLKNLLSNKENVSKMIKMDLDELFQYKKLKMPDMRRVNKYSKKLLAIRIGIKTSVLKTFVLKNSKIDTKLIYKYFDSIKFFDYILYYLQFVYTIKEIKAYKEYNNFLVDFMGSIQYKTYENNYMLINKTTRWSYSLMNSF